MLPHETISQPSQEPRASISGQFLSAGTAPAEYPDPHQTVFPDAPQRPTRSSAQLESISRISGEFPASPPAPRAPSAARLSAFKRPTDFIPPAPEVPEEYRAPAAPVDQIIDVPRPEEEPEEPQFPQRKLGEVLTNAGKLTRPEIHNAIASARLEGQRLGEYLVNEGRLTPLEIVQARSAQTGLPWVDLDFNHIKLDLLDLFPFSKMKRLQFVPFEGLDDLVRIAVANPLPRNEASELSRISGKTLEQYLCREDLPKQFLESIARRFERQRRAFPRFKISLPMSFQCYPGESGQTFSSATFRGRTLDISQGGMQVTGPAILGVEPGAVSPGSLKLMVTVGAVPNDIVGVCETRHVRRLRGSGGGSSCVYGLRLDSMSQQHRDILQGMIDRVTRSQAGIYSDPGPLAITEQGQSESYS